MPQIEALQTILTYGDSRLRALVIVDNSVGETSLPVIRQHPPPPGPPPPPGRQLVAESARSFRARFTMPNC